MQFASDPADGFNIPQGYADPFQQAALQNTFAGNTSYQPGLPGTMLSQNVVHFHSPFHFYVYTFIEEVRF